jgi:hypothetical protein
MATLLRKPSQLEDRQRRAVLCQRAAHPNAELPGIADLTVESVFFKMSAGASSLLSHKTGEPRWCSVSDSFLRDSLTCGNHPSPRLRRPLPCFDLYHRVFNEFGLVSHGIR